LQSLQRNGTPDLIWRVQRGSGGRGLSRARGVVTLARRRLCPRRRGAGLAGETRTRVSGHGSGLGLAWGVVRNTANSPGCTRGRVGLWRGTQTRRRRAEGRSGGAEVLRRRRGGSELGEAAKRGERPPRRPSSRLGSTCGLAESLQWIQRGQQGLTRTGGEQFHRGEVRVAGEVLG
jgi:hypothetical protein